jgi:uncharacterized membrane protein
VNRAREEAMRTTSVGQVVFAATMIGLGVLGLVTGTFPPIWSGVPANIPAREALSYLCAIVALASGAGLLLQRTAFMASRVLLGYLLIWLLLLRVPFVVRNPTSSGLWWGCGATSVMIAGALVLFARFAEARSEPRLRFATGAAGLEIARIFFGLGLIPFGIAHFTFFDRTVAMVPAWLPWHTTWASLTGAAFIAAGLAIIFGVYARLATTLVLLQLALFTLLVWVPTILAHPGASDWSEFIESWTLTAGAWVVADSFRGMAWLTLRRPARANQAAGLEALRA